MALVPPYHTITPEKPYGERDVYHDQNNCPTGRQIDPADQCSQISRTHPSGRR
jgi:hypothetical protein